MLFECGAENAGGVDGVGGQLGVWHYRSPESAGTLKMRETGFRWWRVCVGSRQCARLQQGEATCGSGTVLPGGPVLLTQPGQGPQKQIPARLRAPRLRGAVEPQAQGCPRPLRVEGPGIALWSVSPPSHPAPGGSPGPVSGPWSEAVSSDQAPATLIRFAKPDVKG